MIYNSTKVLTLVQCLTMIYSDIFHVEISISSCWFCWCWTRIKIWGDQSKQRDIRLSLQYEWKGLFITCPSEEASFIWLLFLPRQGQREETSQKISFLCNMGLATCSSLIRTGGTSLDFVPLLCRLFLGCISTYFSELFRARHLECCLSAVAIPQKSTKPHKCLNASLFKKEKSPSYIALYCS